MAVSFIGGGNRYTRRKPLTWHKSLTNFIAYYCIDRCELWGFIREINSGISHVRYQFFPTGTTFTQL